MDGTQTLIILNAYHAQPLFQTVQDVTLEVYVFLAKVVIKSKKEPANLVEIRIQLINTMFKTIYVLFAA